MPTLKQYIEQVALRLGSAGSRAGGEEVNVSVPETGDFWYVAPSDGVVSVCGSSPKSDGLLGCGVFSSGSRGNALTTASYSWHVHSFEVRKGEGVYFITRSLKLAYAKFIPSVGGGA